MREIDASSAGQGGKRRGGAEAAARKSRLFNDRTLSITLARLAQPAEIAQA